MTAHDGARRPDDHVLVLFGAAGDLARRKLLPALWRLHRAGLLPREHRVIGTSRRRMTDGEFRHVARRAVAEAAPGAGDAGWADFARRLSFVPLAPGDHADLRSAVMSAEEGLGGASRRLFYLSVPPTAYPGIVEDIGRAGLTRRARLVLEKPFGTDLDSSRGLDEVVHRVFDEEQVFRIDHFLGKEEVQNILAFRFANPLFESVWTRRHIDHVRIDVPETLGVGTRAGFYEDTGALRDMVVTHLFQVMGVVAMERPASLAPDDLADAALGVFRAVPPLRREDVVRGQYLGYRDEPGVRPGSTTETFAAVRAFVDTSRWRGVPFILRTGKRLSESRRRVTVVFRHPEAPLFPAADGSAAPAHITFDIAHPGGISAGFQAKVPGPTSQVSARDMRFRYADAFPDHLHLDAYERLLHDALVGDHARFTRSDGIGRLWEVVAPVLDDPGPLHTYAPGSRGPAVAEHLLRRPRDRSPAGPAEAHAPGTSAPASAYS